MLVSWLCVKECKISVHQLLQQCPSNNVYPCSVSSVRRYTTTSRTCAYPRLPCHAYTVIVKPMIANWKMIVNWRTLFAFFRLSTSYPFTNYRSFQLKLLLWPHCLFIQCVVTVVRRILNDEIYFITNRFFSRFINYNLWFTFVSIVD